MQSWKVARSILLTLLPQPRCWDVRERCLVDLGPFCEVGLTSGKRKHSGWILGIPVTELERCQCFTWGAVNQVSHCLIYAAAGGGGAAPAVCSLCWGMAEHWQESLRCTGLMTCYTIFFQFCSKGVYVRVQGASDCCGVSPGFLNTLHDSGHWRAKLYPVKITLQLIVELPLFIWIWRIYLVPD